MARGFGAGVLWGLVVVVPGLAIWNEYAPPPAAIRAAEEQAAAEAARVAEEQAAEAARAAEEQAAAARAAEEQAAAEAARVAEEQAAEAARAAEAATQPPEVSAEGLDLAETGEELAPPTAPAGEAPPVLAAPDPAPGAPAAEPAPEGTEPPPAAPELPEGAGDVLAQTGQPEGQPVLEVLPEIVPAPEATAPAPGVTEPAPDSQPDAAALAPPMAEEAPALPAAGPLESTLPTTVMDKEVPGVKVGGLPQIGDAPDTEAEEEPALAGPEDLPPVTRFARPFQPEGKPLFAILLRDLGPAGMARADLAALPFAVSFVIDPLAPDATEAAAAYRGAGQEVVMLANGLPQGATASDVETTFATLARTLPESVALIDQDLGGFQDQRPLATLVLPVIAGQGRGLVTYDRGLNAADQIARREGVPSAVIFRRLDGEGESGPTIRRYLDRAAFKAAQEGAVVVIGDTRPETVAAILEWTVEGKAATVSLAPITAVMGP